MNKEKKIIKIIDKYKISVTNNWATIDYTNSTFNGVHLPYDNKKIEIDDLIFFINESKYNIKIVGYKFNSDEAFFLINTDKKIEIIDTEFPIIIKNSPNIEIKNSNIKLIKFDKEMNYDINIENTNIGQIDLKIKLEEKKWLFWPDLFKDIGNGGLLKAILDYIKILIFFWLQIWVSQAFTTSKSNDVIFAIYIVISILSIFIYPKISNSGNLIKKWIITNYFISLNYIFYYIISIIIHLNLINTLYEALCVLVIFIPLTLYLITFFLPNFFCIEEKKNKLFYIDYFKNSCFLLIIYAIVLSINLYLDKISIGQINSIFICLLFVNFVIYIFYLRRVVIEKETKIKLNLTEVTTFNMDFIQKNKLHVFSEIFVDFNINKVNMINIMINSSKTFKKQSIVDIMIQYNLYLSENILSKLKESLDLNTDDIDYIKKTKLIQKKLNLKSLKSYMKKNQNFAENFFAIIQKFGYFPIKYPIYIATLMFVVGIFIFKDSNMTITDNYIASNIYLGYYDKKCDIKCYELATDENKSFKIPDFYGEYSSVIYTLGLFLPLENNQTKSFKPNFIWIEGFEFIYRFAGYFLWIMFFSKIKINLGDKGEIESKKE